MKWKYCAAAMSVCALSAFAADNAVYRWVDAHGVTRFSTAPPPTGFHARGERFISYSMLPRADRVTKLAADDGGSASKERSPTERGSHPRLPEDFGALEYPPLGNSPYDEKLRRYYESQACFARFRNANGSVKSEAYEHCTEVPFPTRE